MTPTQALVRPPLNAKTRSPVPAFLSRERLVLGVGIKPKMIVIKLPHAAGEHQPPGGIRSVVLLQYGRGPSTSSRGGPGMACREAVGACRSRRSGAPHAAYEPSR